MTRSLSEFWRINGFIAQEITETLPVYRNRDSFPLGPTSAFQISSPWGKRGQVKIICNLESNAPFKLSAISDNAASDRDRSYVVWIVHARDRFCGGGAQLALDGWSLPGSPRQAHEAARSSSSARQSMSLGRRGAALRAGMGSAPIHRGRLVGKTIHSRLNLAAGWQYPT
jgi:hypothetical protein